MPKPPPFPCPKCRIGLDPNSARGDRANAEFGLCPAHHVDYEARWKSHGFSPIGYLEARTHSVAFDSMHRDLFDLVSEGIEREDAAKFYSYFADRIYQRGSVVSEGRFSVEFTIEELAKHVQRHDGRIRLFDLNAWAVKRLTRTEHSRLPWAVLLVHEFYGATTETAEALEDRFAHTRREQTPKDTIRVLPANKTEAEKLRLFSRYAVPANTREWARWMKRDDLNEVAEILMRDYPGLFRPSSLAAYTRAGLSRSDAQTWHGELAQHAPYVLRSQDRSEPLATYAARYAEHGITAEELVAGGWAQIRPSRAGKFRRLGYTSISEVDKWRAVAERIGDEATSEHLRNGTPVEWVRSFLSGAVAEDAVTA